MSDYGQLSSDVQRINLKIFTLSGYDVTLEDSYVDALPANPSRQVLIISARTEIKIREITDQPPCYGVYFNIDVSQISLTTQGGIMLTPTSYSMFYEPVSELVFGAYSNFSPFLLTPAPKGAVSVRNWMPNDDIHVHIIEY
jgi:hypothetical protein